MLFFNHLVFIYLQQIKKKPILLPGLASCANFGSFEPNQGRLLGVLAFVFLQLFLQRVDAGVDGFLEALALLAGIEVVAAQDEADVGNLVLRGVGVVELQRNLGTNHLAVLGAQLFDFLGDEFFKFLVSLEVN